MNKNVVICVSWPYANNNLHLGYIASSLSGDILARYHRMNKDNVLMVSGADSHGTKISMLAQQNNCTPQQIVDKYYNNFVEALTKFNFSFDKFAVTYSDYHKQKVQEIVKKLYKNGCLYEKIAPRPYCEHCKKFVVDTEIEIVCPRCGKLTKADNCDCGFVPTEKDIVNGTCRICGNKITFKDNKLLVFKLTKFKKMLEKLLKDNENIWRVNSVNETKKFLDDLQDRDFTRDLDWGVPVGLEGYEDKVVWVWWEALLGYVTDCMMLSEEQGFDWQDFWKTDHATNKQKVIYMCHAKDNIMFHSLLFPAMLAGINENFVLPDRMVSSEYLLFNNEKISKSNSEISFYATDYANKYDTDSLRFYFTLNGPEKKDLNFTTEGYVAVHNGELVNKFGNLVNRTLKYKGLETLPDGKIDNRLKQLVEDTYTKVGELIEQAEFKKALTLIMDLIAETNKFYDEQKPWVQAKENIDDFNNTISTCAYVIANLSNLLRPFVPMACDKLRKFLNINKEYTWTPIENNKNVQLSDIQPLFARL